LSKFIAIEQGLLELLQKVAGVRFFFETQCIWNSLPFDIRNSCSLASFRRKLKTLYFSTSSHV